MFQIEFNVAVTRDQSQ